MNQKEIVRRTRFWCKKLALSDVDVSIQFKKFSKKDNRDDGDFETVAYTVSNARYIESTVYFNTDRLKLVSDEVIVHELLHIHMCELSGYLYANETASQADKWKGYFEERLVSRLAKILTRKP